MILLPENKRYFVEEGRKDKPSINDFSLSNDNKLYLAYHENNVLFLEDYKISLMLKNKNIIINSKYLHYDWVMNKYYTLDKINLNHIVTVLEDPWDFLYITEGKYAIISEDIKEDKKYICRVIKNIDKVSIISCENLLNSLKDYCIFPEETFICNGLTIQRMVKGLTINEALLNKSLNPNNIFHCFHNLFIGLVEFEKQNFVHCDISTDNIIFIDSKLKFIDFDLYVDSSNPKRNVINIMLTHTVPFFIGLYFIFYNTSISEDIKINFNRSIIEKTYEYYESVFKTEKIKSFFLNNIDIDNITYSYEQYMFLKDENTLQEMYNFLSIYQLVKTLIIVSDNLSMVDNRIIEFFDYCMDFSSKKVHNASEVLNIYEAMFLT